MKFVLCEGCKQAKNKAPKIHSQVLLGLFQGTCLGYVKCEEQVGKLEGDCE